MKHEDLIGILEIIKKREIERNTKINKLCTRPSDSIGAKAIDETILRLNKAAEIEKNKPKNITSCEFCNGSGTIENNEPLTFEELKEIKGSPIWIDVVKEREYSGWFLCVDHSADFIAFEGVFGAISRKQYEDGEFICYRNKKSKLLTEATE